MRYPTLCPECAAMFRAFAGGIGGINFCHHAHNSTSAGVYYQVVPLVEGGHLVHITAPISLAEAEAMRDTALAELEPVPAH